MKAKQQLATVRHAHACHFDEQHSELLEGNLDHKRPWRALGSDQSAKILVFKPFSPTLGKPSPAGLVNKMA